MIDRFEFIKEFLHCMYPPTDSCKKLTQTLLLDDTFLKKHTLVLPYLVQLDMLHSICTINMSSNFKLMYRLGGIPSVCTTVEFNYSSLEYEALVAIYTYKRMMKEVYVSISSNNSLTEKIKLNFVLYDSLQNNLIMVRIPNLQVSRHQSEEFLKMEYRESIVPIRSETYNKTLIPFLKMLSSLEGDLKLVKSIIVQRLNLTNYDTQFN